MQKIRSLGLNLRFMMFLLIYGRFSRSCCGGSSPPKPTYHGRLKNRRVSLYTCICSSTHSSPLHVFLPFHLLQFYFVKKIFLQARTKLSFFLEILTKLLISLKKLFASFFSLQNASCPFSGSNVRKWNTVFFFATNQFVLLIYDWREKLLHAIPLLFPVLYPLSFVFSSHPSPSYSSLRK